MTGVKQTGILILGGIFLTAAAILTGGLGSYGEDQNGMTIAVAPGEAIRVSLSETPSTGYIWNVTLSGDLALARTEFGSSGSLSAMPEADSGTRTWYLTAGNAAVQRFSALRMHQGDETCPPVDRFEMTFVIEG